MLHSITIAGGGSWGTALAHILATRGISVQLWLRDEETACAINEKHENPRYLPNIPLDKRITAHTDPHVLNAPYVVSAIPSQSLRTWLITYKKHFCQNVIFINAAKGIEVNSLMTCSAIVKDVLDENKPRYAVLSGPSFSAEVLHNLPTAVVLATQDKTLGRSLREIFSSTVFRCYSSTDVIGVEMGGALKNIMAIGAGLCDGLKLGHNSRAALITRGLAEMSRLGVACGAQEHTFMGLSGLGDLNLTCTGDLSRNRQVGLRLGRGERLDYIIQSLGMVAEGIKTTAAVHALAQKIGIEAPITAAVYGILYEGQSPQNALHTLMARTLREE